MVVAGEEYERFVDASALNTALDRLAKRLGMLKSEETAGSQRQLPAFIVGVQVQVNNEKQSEVRVGEIINVPTSSETKS